MRLAPTIAEMLANTVMAAARVTDTVVYKVADKIADMVEESVAAKITTTVATGEVCFLTISPKFITL